MMNLYIFKFRKLKVAKEKLRRLQDLVAMVQQSPDVVHALPDDLAELAAGFDNDVLSELDEASQGASPQKRSPAAARSNQQQQVLLRQPPAAAGAAGATNQASPSLALSSEER